MGRKPLVRGKKIIPGSPTNTVLQTMNKLTVESRPSTPQQQNDPPQDAENNANPNLDDRVEEFRRQNAVEIDEVEEMESEDTPSSTKLTNAVRALEVKYLVSNHLYYTI